MQVLCEYMIDLRENWSEKIIYNQYCRLYGQTMEPVN